MVEIIAFRLLYPHIQIQLHFLDIAAKSFQTNFRNASFFFINYNSFVNTAAYLILNCIQRESHHAAVRSSIGPLCKSSVIMTYYTPVVLVSSVSIRERGIIDTVGLSLKTLLLLYIKEHSSHFLLEQRLHSGFRQTLLVSQHIKYLNDSALYLFPRSTSIFNS